MFLVWRAFSPSEDDRRDKDRKGRASFKIRNEIASLGPPAKWGEVSFVLTNYYNA